MKKIEDLFFTVTKILSTARNFVQLHFFYQLLKKQNVVHIWHTFVCRAVDAFCVEQMTFLKKCRAVEIRAVAFRAVDPDSSLLQLK
jgi:hypothetical protein